MELCACAECGLPAEVVRDPAATDEPPWPCELVKVLCVDRHWFCGLRERVVA